MTIWIDPPAWPAHDRLWSHLVSDASLDELHAFAAAQGVPRRGFERDHYDVPEQAFGRLVAAGARPVSSRELVDRLASSGLRRRKVDSMARRAVGRPLLRPPRLQAGDLVAVPATAGVVPPDRLRAGMARLESWGLHVHVADHVLGHATELHHLAASDADRAADFTAAWMDPAVKAVWAARGGYGTQRMLDLLDWRLLAEARPKVLVGFSDVTALHQAVAARLGLVTIHSHVVTSLGRADPASADELRRVVLDPESVVDLFEDRSVETVVPGQADGVLVGGNLALLAAEIGTSSSRAAVGGIVVLEDVAEEPYRVDRLLTQLIRSGWFAGVAAIVLGTFSECGDPAEVDAVLVDRLAPLDVPLVRGFDFGHTASSATVPLGVPATLDATLDSRRCALTLRHPPLACD
ncbi:MAG: DUF4031 domain-containing protein [Nocardioidaceae bacterium]|nr:DUF4031 domain-containing protein [Nocardioidaceae bacterium]